MSSPAPSAGGPGATAAQEGALIVCLAGPTAAGKSSATLQLAQDWPLEVINVDSAAIYRGMDIGTAKPSLQERNAVPHHLLDILDPAQSYSAAAFRRDALQCIADILQRGRIPLLCGGTMLYYKALREGLSDLPSADPALRARIEQEAAQLGWPAMHALLAQVDPVTAARLAPNDSQRLQRALEIYRATGRPMSQWLSQQTAAPEGYRYVTVSLEPSDRSVLHARIAQRYQAMMEQGLLDEVRALRARGDLNLDMPSMRCVGYRQLWQHLEGHIDLPTAVEQAIAATRQLAKRQLTWLRAQPQRMVVDALAPDAAAQAGAQIGALWKQAGYAPRQK